jgi:ABC-2 type transport system permease protein
MRPYLAILGARFRTLLQYRAAAWAGTGTRIFWGLIRVMIFQAFYQSSRSAQPISLPEVVTYVWLGQAFLTLIPFSSADAEVRDMVRTGTVAYELLRPVDLYGFWYARAVALRSTPALFQAPPVFLVGMAFFGMRLPPSPESAAAFLLSTLAALALSSAITTLMSISLLWSISGDGVSRLLPALTYLLSGLAFPLPLCPLWLRTLLEILPFRGMIDTPFRLYVGNLPASALPLTLAHQFLWTIALVLLGRYLLARAQQRMVVQGG